MRTNFTTGILSEGEFGLIVAAGDVQPIWGLCTGSSESVHEALV